jgi:8-amino-7-oxononanoate synthase
MKNLSEMLQERRAGDLYRSRRVSETPQQPELTVNGCRLLSFCSNDYLGLANHPDLVDALQRGAQNYGVGSGAAHLISGHTAAHHALEEELAEFTHRPRALLFSTGYMANLGIVSALMGRGDLLLEDRLNHASLIDAGLLSRATFKRYRHTDLQSLDQMLAPARGGGTMIATDGVFSMDGDLAPLPGLAQRAIKHDAWLLVDDAHGLGVLGDTGRGTLEHFGMTHAENLIVMGTLGKAFGVFGAFVAASEEVIETLIQQARSYVYTTATPPALAEATRASLRLVQTEAWRRQKLQSLIKWFRSGAAELGLQLMKSSTPIQPILAGTAQRAMEWSRLLEAQGLLVTAIRPPTVPEGSARLRVTLSAAHTESQLERLLDALSCLPQEER